MFHDRYTHNSMEIKSIQAIIITGRDTGKKSHQTELQMNHEKSYNSQSLKNGYYLSILIWRLLNKQIQI
jgi:predicted TIM-barrel enzyme